MPTGLYGRALLIIIVPMVVLQSVVAFVFMERHWNTVTRRLSAAVTQDIAALIDIYRELPAGRRPSHHPAHRAASGSACRSTSCPRPNCRRLGPKPFFSLLDQALSQEISARIRRPFWIDTVGRSNLVEIRIRLDDTVMRVFAQRSAAYASNSEIFLLWMVGTSLVLLVVAIIFLRNQIKPILRLADAAESFGKGREVPGFKPRGAREVRRAAQAFIEMKRRVERTMETAHHDAGRRVARPAHDPDALQARAGAARERAGNRRDEEGRRRDGPHARGLSGFRQAATRASSRRRPTWARSSTS